MSQQNSNPGMPLLASAALPAHRLVTAAGALCAADATKDFVGITQEAIANGAYGPVRFTSAGTAKMTASAAISAGAVVYKAASGKIGTTNTNARVGIALEAATGDGSIIEVLPD
jgi:hypothetical protein